MSATIKINAEVVEGELSKVVSICEECADEFNRFKETALEAQGYCGKALDGVIERLTNKEKGSLSFLINDMAEDAAFLKSTYVQFAQELKTVDEAAIDMSI